MERPVVVRGHLSDPRHIDLAEPVSDVSGTVEVTLRAIADLAPGSPGAVLQAMRALRDVDPSEVDDLKRAWSFPSRPQTHTRRSSGRGSIRA